jgi:hypothetical protein
MSLAVAVPALALCLSAVGAQGTPDRALPRLLPEAEEISLALEAALPNVSSQATVYVLRREGHVVARKGSNGFSCLVSRDHAESLYPICYDAEASRAVLPVELREQQLRGQGKTEEEIEREIAAGYGNGTFQPPARSAMAYMMSPRQVIYAGPTGPRVGQYKPHLMLYLPYATRATFGLDQSLDRQVFLTSEGTPRAHLIIPLTDWSTKAAAAP